MGDDSEWLKLPTDEKCQHKLWKARLAGYEESIKLFQTLADEKSPEFYKYLGLVKKFVVDNNAIAQEKGLEATLAFVENAAVAGKAAGEVCSGVIAKCLNQRAKTKDLGVAILMAFIEAEKQEIVQDELMKGLTNKQPKIVAVCVVALREALRDFGTKIISIKPILKQLQALLEDRDKTVRDETKQLAVEIYRWIGPALKPQLANLKPVQVTELESEFEKLPPGKPQQTRFLRSQQDLKAKMLERAAAGAEEAAAEDVDDGASAAPDIDPYELIDPVDILSKLPKDFYEKVEEKKWQERREALEAVQKLAEAPKLEQGDYSDLLRALKKVVAKDSNVMLVTMAAKCIALIATGLRKKFGPHAVGCIEVLIEKFREKKVSVVQTLKEAIDACYVSTNLESISEACIAALDHKTPSVKAETASFLARCFAQCTPATLPKKMLKLYIAPLLKAVNDPAAEVREAAFDALGTAMKVITEKAIMPFLPDVDNLKMAKIKECCEKAVVVGKGGAPKAAGEGGAPAKAAAPAAQKAAAPAGSKGAPGAKPAAKKGPDSAPSSAAPQSTAAGKKKPGAAGGKGKKGAAEVKEEVMERELSDEAVEDKIAELFPGGTLAGLDNANWKERLGAVEKMTEVVKCMARDDIPTQALVRTIAKKPGFKDNNFQVLKLKVELITFLALNSQFTKRSTQFCLTDLMDKISDAKNGSHVQEALSAIAEATSLDFVALQVVQFAFEQKNPKNQSESLNWLAAAIKQFGFKVTVGPLMETIRKALAATNPAVRTSAITLLGIMYMYMGATLRVFFESEKPALLQQIDAEFDKVKGEKAPAPTRGIQPADEAAEEAEEGEEGGSGEPASINIADLVPRTDISERMTETLMNELADKNWKVRKEGLEKVQAIFNEAKFITANVGPLPEALKLRLNDSNKILVTATLTICQTLATSMGPNCKQHVRVIGPGLISNLGDSKPAIRQQAVSALNAWLEQTGMLVFVEAEMFSDALKLENPNLRAELLGWLAEKLPTCKKLPAELQECILHLFTCMEDRNADVRKKAQDALLPFMIHTGYDAMVRHAGKLKPASKDPVMKALEAARANLPQKQPKGPAPSQPVAIKGGGGAAKAKAPVKVDYDEDEPDDAGSRPSSTASGKTGVKGKAKPNGGGAGGATSGGGAAAAGKKGASAAAGNSGGAQGKKKGQEDEDTGPPLKVSNGKEQRFKDEKNLKVLKWNFPTPRPEFLDQLKQQMEPTFSRTVMDQLFHVDFKFQIRAMDTLIKLCEAGPEATIANLDLLLKWLTLRFFDTNTTVLMKALEYLQVIFNALASEDYHLQEIEAVSFIPYLVNKVGDPKDNIRRDVHIILQMICRVYPSSKMFNYLLEGVKSKNAKQRTECLDELGCLITSYGINVCQPSPAVALRFVAQQISDRDNPVRSAALNTIVAAHSILGENVFKYVGVLNEKDQSMLEERIKRSARTRPAGVPPVGGGAAPPPNSRMSPDEKPKPAKAMASTITKMPAAETRNAMPASSRSKGQFQLDFEEIDTSDNYVMPQLLEPDLNEILDEPVKLPVTRMRPPSPAIKLLHNSADAKSAVDLVISQIASNDLTTSLQALRQIDEVLKDSEKSEALHEHVDHFLIACTLQLRVTYSKHMSENAMNREVIRLYRCLLATLISLCKCSNLVREASRDVLKDLIYNLITILLDNRLNDIEDGQEVIRAVNVTVVKFVEQADVTNIMSALIKLLHETVGIETCSPQFLELVMKCLWKMVRMLPTIINDLNLDRVIADTNQFLKAFPSYTWRNKATDMPLRTIKTILHSLAKIKGNKILGHLTLIDHNDHSEVESYLRKVLRTSSDTEMVSTANTRNEQLNGGIENASSAGIPLTTEGTESGQKSPRRISRTVHDTLADIFKKIGSKENTREGLNNLYDFKLKHPDADLDPFLKKSSQFFQDYIERGLKNIAQERDGKLKAPVSSSSSSVPSEVTSTAPVSGSVDNRSNNATIDVSAAEYMERLKVLRARCGLDNSKLDSDLKLRTDSASSSESVSIKTDAARMQSSNISSSLPSQLASATSSTQEAPAASDAPSSTLNLEELKKRLDKIKTARKD